MRSKNKIYMEHDKELADRVHRRGRQRKRTDEERAIKHRKALAKKDGLDHMKAKNTGQPTTKTEQKYFDEGLF